MYESIKQRWFQDLTREVFGLQSVDQTLNSVEQFAMNERKTIIVTDFLYLEVGHNN